MALDQATIAKRYAVALFELTHDQNTDAATLAELVEVRTVLVENPELTKAIASMRVPESAKQQMVATLSDGASQVVKNLLQMAYDYRRFSDLPAIITAYEDLVNKSEGVVYAEVKTAVALSDEQAARMTEQLAKRFEAKEIKLTQVVDEALLGGVVVQANNQILDGSLATKLAAIRQSIIR